MKDMKLLYFAELIVKEAGKILKEAVNTKLILNFKNNDYQDIVTKYDIEIECLLIKRILEVFPSHSFITEEKTYLEQGFKEFTWIIDPIDGTTNFVSIGKDFTISLALYKNKQPLLGVVYDVMKDEMYSAISGKGAFLNNNPLESKKVNYRLIEALIDFSLNTISIFKESENIDISRLVKDIRGHRAYGAASLSICKIPLGQLQGYISAKLNLWDYAAAIIFLIEMGGFAYFDGSKMVEYSLFPGVFIATENKKMCEELNIKLNNYCIK
ncbi:MAG: inositol monophosphatase family protein [Clostridiaceae bacterium]|nr:inositol monophosphatase family protein [Clostridiaceae bacterium]